MEILRTERDAVVGALPSPDELAVAFYGSREEIGRRRRLTYLWYQDSAVKALGSKLDSYFMPRSGQYERAIGLAKRLQELRCIHLLSQADFALLKELAFEEMPLVVHDSVYITALDSQAGTDQRHLLKCAQEWKRLGCYAQTELSHGSAVRDLETTATFDAVSGTFDIHTPSITATKWWVGNLGKTATHAVVIARLIVNGRDHGPHPFHIQLRDAATHAPLPGLSIGDIGPKLGFGAVDNGFLRFDHFKVPHGTLLTGSGQVRVVHAPEGTAASTAVYVPPLHPQAAYRGMLLARIYIVQFASHTLSHASCIAIRFSLVRRQFRAAGSADASPSSEVQVMDYYTQQTRTLPHAAAAFCYKFVGAHLTDELARTTAAAAAGVTTAFGDLHAYSSALKVFVTETVTQAIEDCRRCCGGHGYSQSSGLTRLYTTQVHMVTAEGDNWVLPQQVARYLIKQTTLAPEDISSDMARYVLHDEAEKSAPTSDGALEHDSCSLLLNRTQPVLTMLQQSVRSAVFTLAQQLQACNSAVERSRAWNKQLLTIRFISQAYGAIICIRTFIAHLRGLLATGSTSSECATILCHLCNLFALHTLQPFIGDILLIDCSHAAAITQAQDDMYTTCSQLRPFAILLADCFQLHDDALGSVLGRADGDVYPALVEWVEGEPLNRTAVYPPSARAVAAITAARPSPGMTPRL